MEPESRTPTPQPNSQRRRRKANSKNNKSNGETTNTEKPKNDKRKTDFRQLEVVKLIKRFPPSTINGIATSKLVELAQKQDAANKPLSKKEAAKIHEAHLTRLLRRDPDQDIYVGLAFVPLDPDFPFELLELSFVLCVPGAYARLAAALPSIVVLNTEIPKGFAVNIERGFKQIATLAKASKNAKGGPSAVPEGQPEIELVDGKGLLSLVRTLDRHLEDFLKQEKRATMKLVTFRAASRSATPQSLLSEGPSAGNGATTNAEACGPENSTSADENSASRESDSAAGLEMSLHSVPPAIAAARNAELGQLTARLGSSVKLFNKSAAYTRYKVVVPLRGKKLPFLWSLASLLDLLVQVPANYPQEPARVSVLPNFSTNLYVARKLAVEAAGLTATAAVAEAKQAEKRLLAHVTQHQAQTQLLLVELMCWVANSVQPLASDHYGEWQAGMKVLREVAA